MSRLNLVWVIAIASFLFFDPVYATVGGPTLIDTIKYNSKDNSVYYLVHDWGGRGCQPAIEKVEVTSGMISEVLSCDEIQRRFYDDNAGFLQEQYDQYVQSIMKNQVFLRGLDLRKNNISSSVRLVRENVGEDFVNNWSEFELTVKQNEEEKASIDFRGCYKDQPLVLEGYMILDSEKMALILSRIGDCFEGGYVLQSLYIVDNISQINADEVWSSTQSAPVVNRGSLVVYADEPQEDLRPSPPSTNQSDKAIWWAGFALIAGIGIGYTLSRR